MWAITFEQPGGPEVLRWSEVDDPVPGRGEILVGVRATALNRADLLQRKGLYPAPSGVRPDVPGLEFAGEVLTVGPEVSRFRVGDRVMGLLAGAGYAEKTVTPEVLALVIPENLSWEQAAAVPEAFFTAYDALFPQLEVQAGETLLIHAVASGVGSAALQLARNAGLTVFGTAGSEEKLRLAASLGLDLAIDRHSGFQELVLERTKGRGVDAILDFVGAPYWAANVNCLASRGRLILVGLLGGSLVEVDLGVVLRKRLRVMGTVLRSRSVEEKAELTRQFEGRVVPLLRSGAVRPIVDCVLPLQEAAEAHRLMEANKNAGKIVLKVS